MRILFAGTPEFSVAPLQALLNETDKSGYALHDVIAVFTQPDRKSGRGKKLTPPPVKVVAQQFDIPIYQPHSLRDQVDVIRDLQPDVMIVVAFGMLLPQEILDIPPLGCINIHASILPRWRGAAPIQRAIEAGDKESGVSIMKMELGLDTGPVYQVLTTPISLTDTSITLHDKLSKLGAQGLCETLARLENQTQKIPEIQDSGLANYAKKISKEEARIDWTLSAKEIQQRIRAFNPWPMCQTQHNNTRIRLSQSSVNNHLTQKGNAGQVIAANKDGINVACGDGLLRLEILQRDGSKPLACRDFLNGYEINVGDVLTTT